MLFNWTKHWTTYNWIFKNKSINVEVQSVLLLCHRIRILLWCFIVAFGKNAWQKHYELLFCVFISFILHSIWRSAWKIYRQCWCCSHGCEFVYVYVCLCIENSTSLHFSVALVYLCICMCIYELVSNSNICQHYG